MWFIDVEVEQQTSAPPPEKILDPPLATYTRINAVGTKVQFAFAVPVSGLIPDLKRSDGSFPQASCN